MSNILIDIIHRIEEEMPPLQVSNFSLKKKCIIDIQECV